jgi:NADH:ubiquinone oxidoreductase subunit 6 (subunit J)
MTPFLILTMIVSLLAAVAAMSLRNLVHCALMLAVSFSGVAAIYLQLNAEFVGFTEILVYVGAIAILIVMAILLTRSGESSDKSVLTHGWLAGVAVTAMVFTLLGYAILNSSVLPVPAVEAPKITVKDIGVLLMTRYVLPLEIIALMLTVALIGAVVIAVQETARVRSAEEKPAPVNMGRRQPAAGLGEPEPALAGSVVFKKEGAA